MYRICSYRIVRRYLPLFGRVSFKDRMSIAKGAEEARRTLRKKLFQKKYYHLSHTEPLCGDIVRRCLPLFGRVSFKDRASIAKGAAEARRTLREKLFQQKYYHLSHTEPLCGDIVRRCLPLVTCRIQRSLCGTYCPTTSPAGDLSHTGIFYAGTYCPTSLPLVTCRIQGYLCGDSSAVVYPLHEIAVISHPLIQFFAIIVECSRTMDVTRGFVT
jgi:hypothetical protein